MRFPQLFRAPKHTFSAPLAPEVPFYALGDLHGRDDLLQQLLQQLYDIADPQACLVCVGDYIDRGENSADVLRRIHDLQREAGADVMICLRGNHEQMLLDYLARPDEAGARFLRNGGLQTLASFGVGGVSATSPGAALIDKALEMREAMGPKMVAWLDGLGYQYLSGNVAVVHAAANPSASMSEQAHRHMIWGHRDFPQKDRQDGIWVIHGHTIVPSVDIEPGRIAVDTGAYATGVLSAVAITESGTDILTSRV